MLALQEQGSTLKEFRKQYPGVYTRNVVFHEVFDKEHSSSAGIGGGYARIAHVDCACRRVFE